MQITKLSALSGTLEENLSPIISVLENGLQLSPVAMAKLNVAEKSRIEIGMVSLPTGEKEFYISKLEADSKEGRSLSKTGKFNHPTMSSALTSGKSTGKWEITDNSVEDGGLAWFKLAIFETPRAAEKEVLETASEPALDLVNEVLVNETAPEDVIVEANDAYQGDPETEPTDVRDEIPELNADEEY